MKVNLNKPSGTSSPGAAASKNEIVLFESQTVSYFPPSDENGVVMIGNIQMAPNEIPITIYSTKSKTEAPMETEGDEDTMSFKSSFKAQVPGNTKEIKEFVQYWTGRDIFLAHKACDENFYEFMGTPCAPLQLKSAKQDNNDARIWNLEFMPFAKSGFVPKIYEGTIPFAEPTDVADVSAVTLSGANGVNYQLPSLAVTDVIEFAPVTLDHNKIVSLIGGGGVAPATLVNGVSGSVTTILNGGTTWTALNKSIINLKIFKSGATTYLIEQSRT
jgi:hypothetical protein